MDNAAQGVAVTNTTSSGSRRLLASAAPQEVTVYYDLAGVPSGEASAAQSALGSNGAALVSALTQNGMDQRCWFSYCSRTSGLFACDTGYMHEPLMTLIATMTCYMQLITGTGFPMPRCSVPC